ncbi:MAG: hypothetical protein EHM28_12765 [Spirochaetaceae bacterium]|nr:MAG: hypothetical protein EHM28_12765 [Spirochaetaceae bacterium]
MKKILLAVLLLTGFLATGFSQELDRFFNNEKLAQELTLTEKEKTALLSLWEETEKTTRMARADLEIKTAELKRILMEDKVNQNQAEKVLREAMELEFRIRLAQISRMIKAKEILGASRWAILERFMRFQTEKHMDGMQPEMPRDGRNNQPQRGNMPPERTDRR